MIQKLRDFARELDTFGAAALIIAVVGFIVLICILFWIWFVEAFSFGAAPGLPPQVTPSVVGKGGTSTLVVPDVVNGIDKKLINTPVLGSAANALLNTELDVRNIDQGPQAIWRDEIKWWGILFLLSGFVMLIVKRFVEPVNDETTTMHLKGDTNIALRAKGMRG
ncbi:MAG TPA: hypothetical protein VFJ58_22745 [Armatimonadota bacterium]|nr:hypothetical protein [Armatimonadota bacterium]